MDQLFGDAVNAGRPRAEKLAVDRQPSNFHCPITLKHRRRTEKGLSLWRQKGIRSASLSAPPNMRHKRPIRDQSEGAIDWIARPVNGALPVNVKERPMPPCPSCMGAGLPWRVRPVKANN